MAMTFKGGDMKFKIIWDKKDQPTLEEAQEFVGGWVQTVYLKNGDTLIVNEEGRLRDLPFNQIASNLAGKIITGDVILISKVETLNE